MNYIKVLLSAILVSAVSLSASAGDIFRFGPRVGTQVNNMRLNSDVFNADNRAGFTGGLTAEVQIPVIGLCFDASLMYVHRVNDNTIKNNEAVSGDQSQLLENDNYKKRDYIEIPINVKYKFGLPVVGSFVTPYVFTGPSFAFLTSSKAINEAYKNKSFDVTWNFGVGLQVVNHLQIGASYGIGMTKTLEKISSISAGPNVTGRNNYWTITAAWLF